MSTTPRRSRGQPDRQRFYRKRLAYLAVLTAAGRGQSAALQEASHYIEGPSLFLTNLVRAFAIMAPSILSAIEEGAEHRWQPAKLPESQASNWRSDANRGSSKRQPALGFRRRRGDRWRNCAKRVQHRVEVALSP